MSLKAAAEAARVSVSTVARRLRSPRFRDRVEHARSRLVDEAVGSLSRIASKAVMTLSELLSDDTPAPVRRSAAATILSELLSHRKESDLERRLRLLEESEGEGQT